MFANNVILSQTERITMSSRPKIPKYARNKNVLVVGGSGSGKTRFFIKPNLLQMHSSYVVTDPKGGLVNEVGNALYKNGYRMKVFNTINFTKSMHYNPFAYLHSEKDILKLVTTLIANTKGESKGGDDFWLKAETLLYTALIGYIHYEAPEEEQNFSTLLEMINAMEVREDDEEFKNPVDLMFEELAEQNPDHFAVRQYAKYKLAAGKTAKSILVSCGARLAPFDIKELRDLTAYDELQLDTLGDEKTALFLIMSDTDGTFNFLISMIYTQMFNLLCEKADDVYGGRLPVHVRCLIDEAANIGQIPNLEKLVATIRSREISACLVLQAKSQLKAIYKDNADTIIGNMDSQIFLGGTEQTTLKDLNAILGKETIDMYNTGQSKGSQESYSMNYQKLGKEYLAGYEQGLNRGISITLRSDYQENFESARLNMVLVLGLVAAVLLGIAVLNFVNLLVVKTVSRRREFAVYQSLGMTVSQLRRLVLLEGGFYALLMAAVLLPAALAFALWFMPGVIADLSWVAVYTFDVTPLWIILPVIAALALLTPLLCLYWITKGTIQERLGAVE